MNSENPIMFGIAYKYEEGIWVSFSSESDDSEDTSELDFSCLLPSRALAEQIIEDRLSDGYVAIEIEVEKYHNGITVFAYNEPKEWNE